MVTNYWELFSAEILATKNHTGDGRSKGYSYGNVWFGDGNTYAKYGCGISRYAKIVGFNL